MAYFSSKFDAEEVQSLAFGSIVAGYTDIGTAFRDPTSILLIQNLTDGTLMFSFDGITDHFPIKSSSYLLLDITSNRKDSQGLFLPEGNPLRVKRIDTPTTGSVYVTSFHG